jgi:hypothetical protein
LSGRPQGGAIRGAARILGTWYPCEWQKCDWGQASEERGGMEGRAVADRTNLPPCEVESRWNENFIRFQKSSYSMSPKITIVCMFSISISIFSGAWQENIRFWKQLAKMK